jgi:hypothetical protein
VGVKVEQPHGQDAQQDRDQGAGHQREVAPQPQHQDERGQADGNGGRAGLAEPAEQVPQLLEEVPAAPLDPEQGRQLPGDDGQGEPDDEALEHRLGDEAGQEAKAQQAGAHGEQPGGDGQGGGVGEEAGAALGGDVGHGRRRQRRGCRHRPHHQVPGAAEGGV